MSPASTTPCDNASGLRHEVTGTTRAGAPAVAVPTEALHGAEYAGVDIRTLHSDYPQWAAPVRMYFRASPGGWIPAGIEREQADDRPATGRDRLAVLR